VPNKWLRHLLDALPAIIEQHPTAYLSVAGFGPEEAALRAQAQHLGIADRVRFLGAVPQSSLPALYRRAAILVAPFVRDPSGDQEGLPVVLMEAVGCGCPAVVGDVAGIDDLLGQAAGDVRVQPADTSSLAATVSAALANPEAARRRALCNAREACGHVGLGPHCRGVWRRPGGRDRVTAARVPRVPGQTNLRTGTSAAAAPRRIRSRTLKAQALTAEITLSAALSAAATT